MVGFLRLVSKTVGTLFVHTAETSNRPSTPMYWAPKAVEPARRAPQIVAQPSDLTNQLSGDKQMIR